MRYFRQGNEETEGWCCSDNFFYFCNILAEFLSFSCFLTYVHTQLLSRVGCCDPMDGPSGSSVHGIFQSRILGWVAISFSRGSSQTRDRTHVSCIGRQIKNHGWEWLRNNDEIGFPDDPLIRNPPVRVADTSSIPGSGRPPREGSGNPLQYSCLENPMDKEAWRIVQGVAKSQTWLSDWVHTHPHLPPRIHRGEMIPAMGK